jgi:RNA polymerase sigma-70 factor, ECF subfamily
MAEKTKNPESLTTPETWLEAHGDYLFRFAMLRLSDREAAEDAVQETLLAALKARSGFEGGSGERTWLTGILKHKIVDTIRSQSRSISFSSLIGETEDMQSAIDSLFDETGHWAETVQEWADPEIQQARGQFLTLLEACMSKLKKGLAQVFALRELFGMESEEICKELEISPTNLWVMLHRARMGLRQCLEQHGISP